MPTSASQRIVSVVGVGVLAALTPFIVGTVASVLAVVPLAVAVWLIAPSPWSRSTKIGASLAVVAGAVALAFVFLILAIAGSGD